MSPSEQASTLMKVIRSAERIAFEAPCVNGAHDPEGIQPPHVPGYDILDVLHAGGQGLVFRAIQRSTSRLVALKIPRPHTESQTLRPERFTREIKRLATLKHEHIVSLIDSDIPPNCEWFAMEFIDGLHIDEYCAIKFRIPLYIAMLFAQVVRAIAYVHSQGIVHRDLKPSNLLVDSSGKPWVLDFGLSTEARCRLGLDNDLTVAGGLVGTLRYMSPEQARGCNAIDGRSDIYSLGVVLAELVTGRSPYEEESDSGDICRRLVAGGTGDGPIRLRRRTSSSSDKQLDRDLRAIIETTLRHDPIDRYQSASDFANDLECYANQKPVSATRRVFCFRVRGAVGRHFLKSATALLGIVVIGLMAANRTAAVRAPENADPTAAMVMDSAALLRNSSIYRDQGRLEEAATYCIQALQLHGNRTTGPVPLVAYGVFEKLAQLRRAEGRIFEANEYAEQAWNLASNAFANEPEGSPWTEIYAYANALRSEVEQSEWRTEEALRSALLAATFLDRIPRLDTAQSLHNRIQVRLRLAKVLGSTGDYGAALSTLFRALRELEDTSHDDGTPMRLAQVATNIAAVMQAAGHNDASSDAAFWLDCAEAECANACAKPSAEFEALAIQRCVNAIRQIRSRLDSGTAISAASARTH